MPRRATAMVYSNVPRKRFVSLICAIENLPAFSKLDRVVGELTKRLNTRVRVFALPTRYGGWGLRAVTSDGGEFVWHNYKALNDDIEFNKVLKNGFMKCSPGRLVIIKPSPIISAWVDKLIDNRSNARLREMPKWLQAAKSLSEMFKLRTVGDEKAIPLRGWLLMLESVPPLRILRQYSAQPLASCMTSRLYSGVAL